MPIEDDAAIIMAGHQPAIFHPGVWFKNFALSHLGEANGSLAINLVVDNDVAVGSSIRVPTIDPVTGTAVYRYVAYDRVGGGVPYEQSTITDREQFDRFDQEVEKAVLPLVPNPCVESLWRHARGAIDRCGVAGCALAQARHGLEGEIGLRTLEVPLGVLCRGDAFAEFVLSILIGLQRFHACYNDSADLFRQLHGIRSRAHPVPNLAEQDGWLEAPLWIYGNASPARRAAWVKLAGDHLLLSDRGEREIRIDTADMSTAARQLCDDLGPEFKLRPRALLTTMYARTVLSDLFLHGIGGAKYDQLGDMITTSFFGITPPEYMVISATIQLPGVKASDHGRQITLLKRAMRDTLYQPEKFADHLVGHEDVLRRKRELLSLDGPAGTACTLASRIDGNQSATFRTAELGAGRFASAARTNAEETGLAKHFAESGTSFLCLPTRLSPRDIREDARRRRRGRMSIDLWHATCDNSAVKRHRSIGRIKCSIRFGNFIKSTRIGGCSCWVSLPSWVFCIVPRVERDGVSRCQLSLWFWHRPASIRFSWSAAHQHGAGTRS